MTQILHGTPSTYRQLLVRVSGVAQGCIRQLLPLCAPRKGNPGPGLVQAMEIKKYIYFNFNKLYIKILLSLVRKF